MYSETSTTPRFQVAIVGRPNVGKSELFNRLAGRRIAIVHDQPGITRDRLAAPCTRGKRPFLIWDTGGIGGAGEKDLATEVRAAADAAMRESDLILFMVDAQQGLTPVDGELARLLRRASAPVVLVVNKVDHVKHENYDADFVRLGFKESLSISAAHALGMNDLLDIIERLLPSATESPNEPDSATKEIALAIVGKPNAGKSSLINSILNDQRTIVSSVPGTTRDAVDIAYEREGKRFVLIDTAGIRARSKHSSSVEVFSVMRAERTIRRADLCVLVVDLTSGITSQDKKIAGLIQRARKPCLVALNKWDLVKPHRDAKDAILAVTDEAKERLFFLDYAPFLVASALTGQNVDKLFGMIARVESAARKRISTGVLNRLLGKAFEETPPPMSANKRLKLFYAAQAKGEDARAISPPEFVLFVNDPELLGETYERYLEARLREAEPYPGLPVLLKWRARVQKTDR